MEQASSFFNEAKGMFKVSSCHALWHEFVSKQIKQNQWNESKKNTLPPNPKNKHHLKQNIGGLLYLYIRYVLKEMKPLFIDEWIKGAKWSHTWKTSSYERWASKVRN